MILPAIVMAKLLQVLLFRHCQLIVVKLFRNN